MTDAAFTDLRAKKAEADHHYHTLDDPIMTDAEYDGLVKTLRDAGQEIDEVGAPSDGRFAKVAHTTTMQSLDNAFSQPDVEAWLKGLGYIGPITDQHKFDGLSLSLIYVKGKLHRAVTRGDGVIGEDVTKQAKEVEGVPLTLASSFTDELLEVRGEVVMPRATFEGLNSNLIAAGKKPFANPRNAAAGSLRQKNHLVTRSRGLRFYAFGVTPESLPTFEYESVCLEYLSTIGFTHVERKLVVIDDHLTRLMQTHDEDALNRWSLDFDIDGKVYKIDRRSTRLRLGSTSRAPRWAIAHKFAAEKAVTLLKAIDWQVGRTGIIAPVARLEPVNVGGVLVANATLHNLDEIERLGVRPGILVEVQRAGDVIPQITGTVARTSETEEVFEDTVVPMSCPSCGAPTSRIDVALRCTAGKDCDAQFLGFLEHFTSRDAMNIDGLGPSQITDLFKAKWLNDAASIMELPDRMIPHLDMDTNKWFNIEIEKSLATFPGWGKTSAKNLLAAIKKARTVDLDKFIYALGIPQVGRTTAKDLANWCGSVDRFFSAINEHGGFKQFSQVNGIGEATVTALEDHWTDYHMDEAFALRLICDIHEPVIRDANVAIFAGMTIVFTGALERWPRDTAILVTEELGGKVTNKVTKKTTVLVTGANVGKVKTDDAAKAGVAVWTEDEFITKVQEAVALGYKLDVME